MRAADRSNMGAPKVLSEPEGKGAKERAAARTWSQDTALRSKAFAFSVYKDDEVKSALEALFFGKCAYCESFYSAQAPVDVEHFRPKGAVEGAPDHLGYWWLAMDWDNLLPSCIDCNRRRRQLTPKPDRSLAELHKAAQQVVNTGKMDAFPVAGPRAVDEIGNLELEQALLLNPCCDAPDDHLSYYLDTEDMIALVLPRAVAGTAPLAAVALPGLGNPASVADQARADGVSERGAVSIQVYGLNRLGLVQARTRVLRQLEFLREMIVEIDAIADSLKDSVDPAAQRAVPRLDELVERIIAEIAAFAAPEAPYSALVAGWRRRFLDGLV